MDVIVVSRRRSRTWRFAVRPGSVQVWAPLLLLVALMAGLGYVGGRWLGQRAALQGPAAQQAAQQAQWQQWREAAGLQREALQARVETLAAQLLRVEAAAQRMTEIAGLDPQEFDFSQPPSMGGPAAAETARDYPADPVMASIQALETRLQGRQPQLGVLEDILRAGRPQRQGQPSAWPVKNGYVSSSFGWRPDPFTGARERHTGIDFAGADGSEVLAVAAGVVTEVGPREGYGQFVEIDHGHGYVTRYGHNSAVLVAVGASVRKGQVIARMGNTGRSTGPHLHFEVVLQGHLVNPAPYIEASR